MSNCYSIMDTIYIYKKLLNGKYRLIKANEIERVRVGFKKTNISKQVLLNVNGFTMFLLKPS